ncbi:MAG TPA: CRTAC1 family protein, partial [Saprospiraceae bacterium]|nr:CRTAC1 family protein [Saprospiraceae bacterium]
LYHNNQNGTFSEVSGQMHLNQPVFAMAANFGDFDNDGWLDMFMSTGNPNYRSLIPNRLYKNMGGTDFMEVTYSARVGNLQKGHGVAFADINNNGDQDIYVNIGGAYEGDAFNSAFYLNPGQNDNNWITMQLEGVKSNKAAIGARIRLKFTDNGKQRFVYRDLNSGGSFGSSPLRREIGLGQAKMIDEIQIKWPASGTVQTITNIKPNQFIKITEGKEGYSTINLKNIVFKYKSGGIPMCAPRVSI